MKPPVATIDHDVTFTRSQRNAVPFRLDPWTGAIAQIGEYVEDGDRVPIRITLKPGEATIIAFRPGRRVEVPATGAELAPISLDDGHRLPPVDLLNPVVDLSGHLRRGRNTAQVEVATTLLNRLRVAQPTVYSGPRQSYGLLGPVHLIPRSSRTANARRSRPWTSGAYRVSRMWRM